MQQGIYKCNDFSQIACIVKIIQVIISLVMLAFVFYVLIMRVRRQCRLSFYVAICIFMALTLVFIIANAFRTDLNLFLYLSSYSYSVYFSLIVLKLGIKLLTVIRPYINYNCLRKTFIISFFIYQCLLAIVLGYSISRKDQSCFALPFLISNSISILGAILFVVIGMKHSRYQEQRIDLTMSQDKMRNPLPRFQCWVAVNFMGQVMVLIQSIIFQLNDCKFTDDENVNQVCRLLFQFLSFHLGILATIYFFNLSNKSFKNVQITRVRDSTFGDTPRGIQMVNLQYPQQRGRPHQTKTRTKTTAATIESS